MQALKKFTAMYLKSRPVINVTPCTGCGKCKKTCPAKAADLFALIPDEPVLPKTGDPRFRPEIDYIKCSRCYKCAESCPRSAIAVHKPVIAWLFGL